VLNIPDPKDWKNYSIAPTAPFKERFFKKLDNVKNAFKSDGALSASQAEEYRKFENAVQAEEKTLVKVMNQIDGQFKEIAKGADVLELPRYLQTAKLKYPKPITAVDDQMYLRNNDLLYDYLQARRVKTTKDGKELFKDSDEAIEILNKLPKNTQKNAKELKKNINNLSLRYGKLLSENTDDALKDLGASIVESGGAYLKQVFSVMKNKAYTFNPQKVNKAKDFFKKFTVPKIESSHLN